METSIIICSNLLVFTKTSGIFLLRLTGYSEGMTRGSHLVFTNLHFYSQHNPSVLCQYSHAWKSTQSFSHSLPVAKADGVNVADRRVCSHSAVLIAEHLFNTRCGFLIEWLFKMFGFLKWPLLLYQIKNKRGV